MSLPYFAQPRLTQIKAYVGAVRPVKLAPIASNAANSRMRRHGVAGELRFNGSNLLGDLNGDKSIDFQILLAGSPMLTVDDLVL